MELYELGYRYTPKQVYDCHWCGKSMTREQMSKHVRKAPKCREKARAYCVRTGLNTAHLDGQE